MTENFEESDPTELEAEYQSELEPVANGEFAPRVYFGKHEPGPEGTKLNDLLFPVQRDTVAKIIAANPGLSIFSQAALVAAYSARESLAERLVNEENHSRNTLHPTQDVIDSHHRTVEGVSQRIDEASASGEEDSNIEKAKQGMREEAGLIATARRYENLRLAGDEALTHLRKIAPFLSANDKELVSKLIFENAVWRPENAPKTIDELLSADWEAENPDQPEVEPKQEEPREY